MAYTCSECTYLDLDKEYNCGDGRFWCETKYEWHYANEAECWRFCKAYSRPTSVSKSYHDYSKSTQSSSGCYITTIVCDILGLEDNVLNSLRNFRDNIMAKDEKYKYLLAEYDIIGRIIAVKIKNDPTNHMMSLAIYETFIREVCDFINKKEYLNAIKTYTNMVKGLIKYYNITRVITQDEIENLDIKKLGHGKIIV